MTALLWILAAVAMAGFGAFVTRLSLPARLPLALAVGTVIGGAVMFLMSVAGIPWTRLSLAIPLLGAVLLLRRGQAPSPVLHFGALLFIAVFFYALWNARTTSPDLLYFWGPKAVHFHRAQAIDVEFLKAPHYRLMHSDYPPLLPMAHVFASTLSGAYSWWGALLLSGIYLAASVSVFQGLSRSPLFATLLAALLCFAFIRAVAGGTADPLLVFFAVTALSLLTFSDDRGADVIASIALAGAVLTKVEGAVFAAIVVVAATLLRARRWLIAVAPAAALGAWLLFVRYHGLFDSYPVEQRPLYFNQLPTILGAMLRQASYGAFCLPWLAVFTPLAFGRNWKRAALPLLVAAGSVAALIFFYLHSPDPSRWVRESAERVLFTTLASLTIAAAAASRE